MLKLKLMHLLLLGVFIALSTAKNSTVSEGGQDVPTGNITKVLLHSVKGDAALTDESTVASEVNVEVDVPLAGSSQTQSTSPVTNVTLASGNQTEKSQDQASTVDEQLEDANQSVTDAPAATEPPASMVNDVKNVTMPVNETAQQQAIEEIVHSEDVLASQNTPVANTSEDTATEVTTEVNTDVAVKSVDVDTNSSESKGDRYSEEVATNNTENESILEDNSSQVKEDSVIPESTSSPESKDAPKDQDDQPQNISEVATDQDKDMSGSEQAQNGNEEVVDESASEGSSEGNDSPAGSDTTTTDDKVEDDASSSTTKSPYGESGVDNSGQGEEVPETKGELYSIDGEVSNEPEASSDDSKTDTYSYSTKDTSSKDTDSTDTYSSSGSESKDEVEYKGSGEEGSDVTWEIMNVGKKVIFGIVGVGLLCGAWLTFQRLREGTGLYQSVPTRNLDMQSFETTPKGVMPLTPDVIRIG